MQNHKVCILIAATLIAIGQHSCQALTCSTGGAATETCADTVTQCFTKLDGTTTTRGCLKDASTCTSPNCLTCTTDNCNAFLMCKHCDGSQAGCSTLVGDVYYEQCTTATQQCLNQLNGNNTVTRGCGEPCASGATNCQACNNADNCNSNIFPAGRRTCYQCNGANCETLVNATTLMPCAIYQAEAQQCYTIGTGAAAMQRGCQLDAAATNKCAGATPDASCVFCSNADGCNNSPYSRVLGSCIKCSDAAACVPAQTDAKPAECAAAVYTQTANSCYMQLYDNGTVARGCTNELSGGCNAASGCTTCEASGCNTLAGVLMCLTCRSDNYAPCRTAAVGVSPCKSSSGMKCFSGEWDGVVVRGCLADAGALMKYQCENDADTRCTTCTGMGCNDKKYNGAGTLQHMGLGLLGLIFVVKQLI